MLTHDIFYIFLKKTRLALFCTYAIMNSALQKRVFKLNIPSNPFIWGRFGFDRGRLSLSRTSRLRLVKR